MEEGDKGIMHLEFAETIGQEGEEEGRTRRKNQVPTLVRRRESKKFSLMEQIRRKEDRERFFIHPQDNNQGGEGRAHNSQRGG